MRNPKIWKSKDAFAALVGMARRAGSAAPLALARQRPAAAPSIFGVHPFQ